MAVSLPVCGGRRRRLRGGGGDRFLSRNPGWSLLTSTVAKMESMSIEGDRVLNGGSWSGKRLPICLDESSCHRQMFSSCGGAWKAVGTVVMVVAVVVVMWRRRFCYLHDAFLLVGCRWFPLASDTYHLYFLPISNKATARCPRYYCVSFGVCSPVAMTH